MYKTCPKCGYERQGHDDASREECPSCGLVFSKWIKSLISDHELQDVQEEAAAQETWQKGVKTFFCHPQPDMRRGDFLVYVAVFVVFLIWGVDFILMDFHTNAIGRSWLHNVDLIFHEAGHFFFIPFGRYVSILDGSLFQVIVPLILMLAFLIHNKDSMHDWANLLRPIGLLEVDIHIATAVDLLGAGVLLLALVWAARMLFIYYRDMV